MLAVCAAEYPQPQRAPTCQRERAELAARGCTQALDAADRLERVDGAAAAGKADGAGNGAGDGRDARRDRRAQQRREHGSLGLEKLLRGAHRAGAKVDGKCEVDALAAVTAKDCVGAPLARPRLLGRRVEARDEHRA